MTTALRQGVRLRCERGRDSRAVPRDRLEAIPRDSESLEACDLAFPETLNAGARFSGTVRETCESRSP